MIAFYSVEQVALLFRCSERQVLELVRRGELRGAKFGNGYTFSSEDVAACYRQRAGIDAPKPLQVLP
jgi:excisionase family DNA binding protein